MSQYLDFVYKNSSRTCMVVYIVIARIINSKIERSVFYIKLKKINFDLRPL